MPEVRNAGAMPLPDDCWQQIFGNDRPVALEIGPGRGEFLLAIARTTPERNFFAIEHSAARAAAVADRLARSGLANARVIAGDATCLLELVPEGSVAAVYILFPDPWWKRRHHKRRLLKPGFVAAVRRSLRVDGTLELVTDVAEYFTRADATLAADPLLERVPAPPLGPLDTSFARKAARRGDPLHRCVYRRRARA